MAEPNTQGDHGGFWISMGVLALLMLFIGVGFGGAFLLLD